VVFTAEHVGYIVGKEMEVIIVNDWQIFSSALQRKCDVKGAKC
jgi:hypothetical protein